MSIVLYISQYNVNLPGDCVECKPITTQSTFKKMAAQQVDISVAPDFYTIMSLIAIKQKDICEYKCGITSQFDVSVSFSQNIFTNSREMDEKISELCSSLLSISSAISNLNEEITKMKQTLTEKKVLWSLRQTQ